MTPESQVRDHIYNIIARGKKGQLIESDNVEAKLSFSNKEDEKERVARQIAGCANAALGNEFTFLFGVREESFEVVGISKEQLGELPAWWNGIKKHFAFIVPRYKTYVISYDDLDDDLSLVALIFDTSNPPYMVKNSHRIKKDVMYEILWREGNEARPATHEDIVGMLRTASLIPEHDAIDVFLTCGKKSTLDLTASIYVTSRTQRTIVLPFYRCETMIKVAGESDWTLMTATHLSSAAGASSTIIQQSYHDVMLRDGGAGEIRVHANCVVRLEPIPDPDPGTSGDLDGRIAYRDRLLMPAPNSEIDFMIKIGVAGATSFVVGGTLTPTREAMRSNRTKGPGWQLIK